MLTAQEVEFLQKELEKAKNPLFIYDGDADGLCSFLLLYRKFKKGKGFIVKTSSTVDVSVMRKVDEVNPDIIIVLDMPLMQQEFVDKAKRPIFWIDHHPVQKLQQVHYYNPRLKDALAYIPTTRMAYQVSNDPQDLWIATIGCLADWHMPDFVEEFIQQYPQLLQEKKDLADAIYKNPVGQLIKMVFFLLKGKHQDAVKCINILTRITSPQEILQQETAQGKLLWKRFQYINEKYNALLIKAKEGITRDKLISFAYEDNQWSFTSELSNELSALYPKKFVLVFRRKGTEVKCSLRGKTPVLPALEKALVGIDGHGGGHPQACGIVVKEHDWERFLNNLKEELKDA